MKFLHCADLHLALDEKAYSLSVLAEIIEIAGQKSCDCLFFSGDVFDSRPDLEALRGDFRAAIEKLPTSCKIFFIPGNHEDLRAKSGAAPLGNFDFGRNCFRPQKPFSLEALDADTELLCIPFQTDYAQYRAWQMPPKGKKIRIALAHGLVPGMAWRGVDEEAESSVIDSDLFAFLQADIACLGHIHNAGEPERFGSCLAVYAGSARVWRKGESGPRRALFGDSAFAPVKLESIAIKAAGQYRLVPLHAEIDGSLSFEKSAFDNDGALNDWIECDVSGVVEDENALVEALRRLKAENEKKFRRFEIPENREKLYVLSGLSENPLAARFLKKWEAAADQYQNEAEAYELARLKGLVAIKEILEARG